MLLHMFDGEYNPSIFQAKWQGNIHLPDKDGEIDTAKQNNDGTTYVGWKVKSNFGANVVFTEYTNNKRTETF